MKITLRPLLLLSIWMLRITKSWTSAHTTYIPSLRKVWFCTFSPVFWQTLVHISGVVPQSPFMYLQGTSDQDTWITYRKEPHGHPSVSFSFSFLRTTINGCRLTPLGHQLHRQTSQILGLGSIRIHRPSFNHRHSRTFRASLGSLVVLQGLWSWMLRVLFLGCWLTLTPRFHCKTV